MALKFIKKVAAPAPAAPKTWPTNLPTPATEYAIGETLIFTDCYGERADVVIVVAHPSPFTCTVKMKDGSRHAASTSLLRRK